MSFYLLRVLAQMYSIEFILQIVSGGFLCWLTGLGAGISVRYLRNIVISASSN